MNRITLCLIVIAFLFTACSEPLNTRLIQNHLSAYRGAIAGYVRDRQPQCAERMAGLKGALIVQAEADARVRAMIMAEIREYSRKQYPEHSEPNRPRRRSETETVDYVYFQLLADLLREASLESFLRVTEDVLADPNASEMHKKLLFDKVFSNRFTLKVTQPQKLAAYDREVLALGMQFIDPSDGLRFTFGDRFLFERFVIHLLGYRDPPLSLPPIDRETGLELAWRYINNDTNPYLGKIGFMGRIEWADPAIRAEYVRTLRAHVNDSRVRPKRRIEYASKLVELGEMTGDELKELEQTIEDDEGQKRRLRNR